MKRLYMACQTHPLWPQHRILPRSVHWLRILFTGFISNILRVKVTSTSSDHLVGRLFREPTTEKRLAVERGSGVDGDDWVWAPDVQPSQSVKEFDMLLEVMRLNLHTRFLAHSVSAA